jgi:iron complex transport system substrate-binding protein
MKTGAIRAAALAALVSAPFIFMFLLPPSKNAAPAPSASGSTFISLSPSVTRMIEDMGEGSKVTGVTSFDNISKGRVSVGSLISPNLETILLLKPDIIFFSGEDSPVQKTEQLKISGVRLVSIPRATGFEDIIRNYELIARETGSETGLVKVSEYRSAAETSNPKGVSVVFLVSHSPFVAASASSFIGEIVSAAGGSPAELPSDKPFPLISKEALVSIDPDCIITTDPGGTEELSSMLAGFPHLKCVRDKRIFQVPADTACYYTPKDYIETRKILSKIFDSMGKRAE